MKIDKILSGFRNFKTQHRPFILLVILYLISVLIVAPWGNYAIGDDLYYLIQIQGFREGDLIKNGHIDTSIILQIFIGLGWTTIFGENFVALKILTILVTIGIIFLLLEIFKKLNVSNSLSIVGVILIIFNPKFFHVSLSFNSEVYFLGLLLLGTYFLIIFNQSLKIKYFLLASVFAGLSVLVRQVGVLFIFPLLLTLLLNLKKISLRYNILKYLGILIIFSFISALGIFWPKHLSEFQENSKSLLGVINFNKMGSKFINLWREIPYLATVISPLIWLFIKNLSNKIRFLVVGLGFILGIYLYQVNIFSVGNIVYVEGIDARSYTRLREHLLNNEIFKNFLAFFLGITFTSGTAFLISRYQKIKSDKVALLLLFSAFVYLFSILLADVLYERYYLYFEFFLVILIIQVISLSQLQLGKITFFLTSILVLITTIYSLDFHYDIKAKWKMADEIAQIKGIKKEEVFVQDNYLKFNYISRLQDYAGLRPIKPNDPNYQCFVVNRVVESPNFLRDFLEFTSLKIRNLGLINNEGIDGFGFTASQVENCNDCRVLQEVYYFSPLYETVGKSKFVRVYCLDEKR